MSTKTDEYVRNFEEKNKLQSEPVTPPAMTEEQVRDYYGDLLQDYARVLDTNEYGAIGMLMQKRPSPSRQQIKDEIARRLSNQTLNKSL